MLDKCQEVISWLDANTLAEKDEFEHKRKWELEQAGNPIISRLYQGAGGPGAGGLGLRPLKGALGLAPPLRRWIRNPSPGLLFVMGDSLGSKALHCLIYLPFISHQLCKLFGMLNCPFGEVRNSFQSLKYRANVYCHLLSIFLL